MIEIIHHGDTSERTMCPKCHCEFRYSKVDTKWKNLITEYIGCVCCPECGKEIIVERINERESSYE